MSKLVICNPSLAEELEAHLTEVAQMAAFSLHLEAHAKGIDPHIYRAEQAREQQQAAQRSHELRLVEEIHQGLKDVARAIQYQGHWHYR